MSVSRHEPLILDGRGNVIAAKYVVPPPGWQVKLSHKYAGQLLFYYFEVEIFTLNAQYILF